MPNVTISLDEKTLKVGREYARMHHTSLNALIRETLNSKVRPPENDWLEECLSLMDRAKAHSHGKKWKREDLHVR